MKLELVNSDLQAEVKKLKDELAINKQSEHFPRVFPGPHKSGASTGGYHCSPAKVLINMWAQELGENKQVAPLSSSSDTTCGAQWFSSVPLRRALGFPESCKLIPEVSLSARHGVMDIVVTKGLRVGKDRTQEAK